MIGLTATTDWHRDDSASSASGVTIPRVLALGDGFLAAVERFPHHEAVNIGDASLSYQELATAALTWASALSSGQPVRRVALLASRSETLYGGILASLFAGATYVPLNVSFPAARNAAMLKAAGCDALIVDETGLRLLGAILQLLDPSDRPELVLAPKCPRRATLAGGPRLVFAEDLRFDPSFAPKSPALSEIAYILFTSGSTGQPKGVPISHANVAAFLTHNLARYRIGPRDRLSQTFDPTFDLSVFDMFMAWWAGACVCAVGPHDLLAPSRFIQQKGITVWFSVPSVARLMLQGRQLAPHSLPGLRLSLFCGEALPRKVAEAWAAAAPNGALDNIYGPTELTIALSAYRWNPATSPAACVNDVVPIGRPYPGLDFQIIDEVDRPVAPGATGILCVDGPQRFAGYLDDAERTAQAFFLAENGRTYYRTGDLVFQNATGDLCFVGRRDSQVKVNGYRIELGEVEGAARKIPGVVEVAVVVWPAGGDGAGASELVAFIMSAAMPQDQISMNLRRSLPSYMVPRRVVFCADFPLNANGKIDRNALIQSLLLTKGA